MSNQHPQTFDLERLSVGEVNNTERRELEAHLESCHACRDLLEELEAGRAAFLEQVPPEQFASRLIAREAQEKRERELIRRPLVFWGGGLALAAAAAALLFALLAPSLFSDRPLEDSYRLMGSTAVRVFLRHSGRVVPYREEPLRPGDALQLEVISTDRSYAVLLAISPADEPPIALIPEGESAFVFEGQTLLPGSIEVTSDPEPVLLLLVVRERPFETTALVREVQAMRDGAPLSSWDGVNVPGAMWSLLVQPETP